jgi:ClpP class serine protease
MFLADVAAGRGVKVSAVKADFGQGRTMMAQEALKAGMVDRVATLEQIIDELSGRIKARQSAQRAAELRELQLRTLQ